jgi:tetratricopeptide (TPR) repeat protein
MSDSSGTQRPLSPNIIENEILRLLGNHCAPQVLADFAGTYGLAHFPGDTPTPEQIGIGLQGGSGLHLDRERLDQIITLWQEHVPQQDIARFLLGIGGILVAHGELSTAEEMYSLALARGEETGEKPISAEAYSRRGELRSRQGRWKEAMTDLRLGLDLYRELKDTRSIAQVENILGTNFAEQGKMAVAQWFFTRALETFEQTNHLEMTATVVMNMGIVCTVRGETEKGLAYYKRAQSHFETVGETRRLAEVHHNMGMSYLHLAQYEDAVREFDLSYSLGSRLRNVQVMGLASLGKATALFRLNDLAPSLRLVNQAIGHFSFCSDRLSLADSYKVKGMIHRELKNYGFAESYLQTSLRINRESDNHMNIAETLFEIGLLEQKRGNNERALAVAGQACARFKKVGAARELAQAKAFVDGLKGKTDEPR